MLPVEIEELIKISMDADERGDEELSVAAQVVVDYLQGRRKLKDRFMPADGQPGRYENCDCAPTIGDVHHVTCPKAQ